jgi:hypothetical protein
MAAFPKFAVQKFYFMQQAISPKNLQAFEQNTYQLEKSKTVSVAGRFIAWCDAQEDQRFLWLGIALMGNIGMLLPLTLLTVLLASGNNFLLWVLTVAANVPVLAVNLAAQPTKVTLPFLFSSWFLNIMIIISSLIIAALN